VRERALARVHWWIVWRGGSPPPKPSHTTTRELLLSGLCDCLGVAWQPHPRQSRPWSEGECGKEREGEDMLLWGRAQCVCWGASPQQESAAAANAHAHAGPGASPLGVLVVLSRARPHALPQAPSPPRTPAHPRGAHTDTAPPPDPPSPATPQTPPAQPVPPASLSAPQPASSSSVGGAAAARCCCCCCCCRWCCCCYMRWRCWARTPACAAGAWACMPAGREQRPGR